MKCNSELDTFSLPNSSVSVHNMHFMVCGVMLCDLKLMIGHLKLIALVDANSRNPCSRCICRFGL